MKTLVATLLLVSVFGTTACNSPEPATEEPAPVLTERQTQLWVRSCAFCHIDGNAGAPVIGAPEQWLPAQAKTDDELLTSVIEGINDMPPLGYCMACEREDFRALIKFMMPSEDVLGGAQR